MTAKVIYDPGEKATVISGSLEKPAMGILYASEGDTVILVDVGKAALVVSSREEGGGARRTRLFTLNRDNPTFEPEKEHIYLPYINKVEFMGARRRKES